MLLWLMWLAPWCGALILASQPKMQHSAWLAGITVSVSALAFAFLTPDVWQQLPPQINLTWLDAANLGFALRLDGLSWLFSLLIIGFAGLLVVYSKAYFNHAQRLPIFYAKMLLFMGAMLGVVIADNLLLLAISWELTSICSALLIAFWGKTDARQAARLAWWVTGATGLCLIAGFILLGQAAGTFQISELVKAGSSLATHSYFLPAMLLILVGALAKSAQFPFHFWLPNGMTAPTPASAYLHSATMVNAGLFIMLRLHPVYGENAVWQSILMTLGSITLVFGAATALFRNDIKGVLAYSTVSHLGLVTLLIGIGSPLAIVAAIFHLLNHATFKASLFMAAGMIDHVTGTRDLRLLRGLFKFMPITACLMILASAAMAGVPLLNGFLSKELFYAALLPNANGWAWLAMAAAWIGTLLGVTYSLRLIMRLFFGQAEAKLPHEPHEPETWFWLPMAVLVVLCVLVGFLPHQTVLPMVLMAAKGLSITLPDIQLSPLPHFNAVGGMSIAALLGGYSLYFFFAKRLVSNQKVIWYNLGRRLYEHSTTRALNLAKRAQQSIYRQGLRLWVGLLLLATMASVSPAFNVTGLQASFTLRDLQWQDAGTIMLVALMMVAACCVIKLRRKRAAAALALGIVGLGLGILFMIYSSPDVAFTQLSIEIVSTLLLFLALPYLAKTPEAPKTAVFKQWKKAYRALPLFIASGVGLGMMLITANILSLPVNSIADYFWLNSLPYAAGANVVNVIIVDFRGFDTFGEMTVLAITGLIVAMLIPKMSISSSLQKSSSVMLQRVGIWMMPFAWTLALFLLLRGHQLPGGGFIAGLVIVIAYATRYMAYGLPTKPSKGLHYLLLLGLGLASLTVWIPLLLSGNVLQSAHYDLHLGALGSVGLASAAVFDTGVFCVVIAAGLIIFQRIAQPQGQGASS